MAEKPCQARQYSDTMLCHACGLQWDVNDPERPQCDPIAPRCKTVTCSKPKAPVRYATAEDFRKLKELINGNPDG